jgi:hypothetical protein
MRTSPFETGNGEVFMVIFMRTDILKLKPKGRDGGNETCFSQLVSRTGTWKGLGYWMITV